MLATLTRYDGWFLLLFAAALIVINVFMKRFNLGDIRQSLKDHTLNIRRAFSVYPVAEGTLILFLTLAGLGVALWFLWNQLIFKDALYFILGPFSAHAQQLIMEKAGALPTKHNLLLSTKIYFYSLFYNTYTVPALVSILGFIVLALDKKLSLGVRICTTILWSSVLFNILSLFFGFSVIFVQGISGNTWFNIRYGVMVMPAVAVGIGYLVDRAHNFRLIIIGFLAFVLFFAFVNHDSVAIDDARVGSSQKNVSQVAGFLNTHAANQNGFILISAASHDAIIFSSGLPMKRFIHEGTGEYWLAATAIPDRWARWIVMRTYDDNDLTWKAVSRVPGFKRYHKVASYPFADVYELDSQYFSQLITEPVFGKQK